MRRGGVHSHIRHARRHEAVVPAGTLYEAPSSAVVVWVTTMVVPPLQPVALPLIRRKAGLGPWLHTRKQAFTSVDHLVIERDIKNTEL